MVKAVVKQRQNMEVKMAQKKSKAKTKAVKRKASKKVARGKKTVKKKTKKQVIKKKAKTKKAVTKKAVKKKGKKKRKLNPAFMQPLMATDALASIVGAKRLTRQKAIKHFWDYVKKKKLQDSKNRRNINLDDKLKKLFGNKKQVDMFEAAKVISKNLSK